MAPLNSRNKVLLLASILVFLFSSTLLISASQEDDTLPQTQNPSTFSTSRKMLQLDEEDEEIKPKKIKPSTPQSFKNQTKLIKPSSSSKNQTKLLKPTSTSSSSSKNQTKLIKPSSSSKNQTKLLKPTSTSSSSSKNQTKLIKPTSPSLSSSKNQTKPIKPSTTNSTKSSSPNIKTTLKKLNSTSKPSYPSKTSDLTKPTSSTKPTTNKKPPTQKPSWIDNDEDDVDFVSDLTDLPNQFQQTLLPDLERLSTTSKLYLAKANTQMTQNFIPFLGTKYAPFIASFISFAFLLLPLLLVSLLFHRIKSYFSLQKLLIFTHIYLSIYFSILSLSSLVTSLEPLRFFYSTSQSTYISLQLLQTLAYVLYLLLLLMYLLLVFSTDSGLGSKLLGLAQCFVGLSIGLHYYMSVFHRAVMRLPPKTNWKVHGVYATCYFVICVAATMERRKKPYLEEGGEEGKKN